MFLDITCSSSESQAGATDGPVLGCMTGSTATGRADSISAFLLSFCSRMLDPASHHDPRVVVPANTGRTSRAERTKVGQMPTPVFSTLFRILCPNFTVKRSHFISIPVKLANAHISNYLQKKRNSYIIFF